MALLIATSANRERGRQVIADSSTNTVILQIKPYCDPSGVECARGQHRRYLRGFEDRPDVRKHRIMRLSILVLYVDTGEHETRLQAF